MAVYRKLNIEKFYCCFSSQPSPHFSRNKINAILLNGQHAVTAITALWLWRSTAFRWLQQPIGRYLMSDVVEQVIQRHPEVKNEGIPEADAEAHQVLASEETRRSGVVRALIMLALAVIPVGVSNLLIHRL